MDKGRTMPTDRYEKISEQQLWACKRCGALVPTRHFEQHLHWHADADRVRHDVMTKPWWRVW